MNTELIPFLGALRGIVHDAGLGLLGAADADTLRRSVARYNAVSLYLITRIPDIARVYRPLSVEASAGSLRMAARDVASFVEAPDGHSQGPGPGERLRPAEPPGEPVVLLKPPGRSCACRSH